MSVDNPDHQRQTDQIRKLSPSEQADAEAGTGNRSRQARHRQRVRDAGLYQTSVVLRRGDLPLVKRVLALLIDGEPSDREGLERYVSLREL